MSIRKRSDREYAAHLQGTLDLLILRTLVLGPQHGQAIARAIQSQSDNVLIVDHGSQTFSLYGNLLDMAVAKGARVDRGEVVGHVGLSPSGPAGLYFELRVDGHPVDPLQWLKRK